MKSRVLAAASALAAAGVLVLALRCVWWRSGAGDSRSFATPPHDRSGPAPQQSPAGGAGKARAPAASVETEWPVRFRDVTGECGITFEHRDGSSGRHFTPETMSAGVATFDYDGDGLIDISFPQRRGVAGRSVRPPATSRPVQEPGWLAIPRRDGAGGHRLHGLRAGDCGGRLRQ